MPRIHAGMKTLPLRRWSWVHPPLVLFMWPPDHLALVSAHRPLSPSRLTLELTTPLIFPTPCISGCASASPLMRNIMHSWTSSLPRWDVSTPKFWCNLRFVHIIQLFHSRDMNILMGDRISPPTMHFPTLSVSVTVSHCSTTIFKGQVLLSSQGCFPLHDWFLSRATNIESCYLAQEALVWALLSSS